MTLEVGGEHTITVDPVVEATTGLKGKYESVGDDPREGFSGLLVPPEKLTEVAAALRSEYGFNYLSSVTGVDLIADDKMEVVYHFYSIEKGGSAVVLKSQVTAQQPHATFPDAGLARSQLPGARGLRPAGHQFQRAPRPAPYPDVGRL